MSISTGSSFGFDTTILEPFLALGTLTGVGGASGGGLSNRGGVGLGAEVDGASEEGLD